MSLSLYYKMKLKKTRDRIIIEDNGVMEVKKCIEYRDNNEVITEDEEIIPYEKKLKNRRNKIFLSNVTGLPLMELNKARSIIESHLIKRLTREKLTIFEFILVVVCMGAIVMSFISYKELAGLTKLIRGV